MNTGKRHMKAWDYKSGARYAVMVVLKQRRKHAYIINMQKYFKGKEECLLAFMHRNAKDRRQFE